MNETYQMSVQDVYNEDLCDLNKRLGPTQRFVAFRTARTGELYLTTCTFNVCTATFNHALGCPRLIVEEQVPLRYLFEEVLPTSTTVAPGLWIDNGHVLSLCETHYYNLAHYPVYKRTPVK